MNTRIATLDDAAALARLIEDFNVGYRTITITIEVFFVLRFSIQFLLVIRLRILRRTVEEQYP